MAEKTLKRIDPVRSRPPEYGSASVTLGRPASNGIDWILIIFIAPIIAGGLVTMKSFAPLEATGDFFGKQVLWVLISLAVFLFFLSLISVF